MITVKLISASNKNILSLMSFAARSCYEKSEPEWGKKIDIKTRVFDPGHHSIPQHPDFAFFIEGIAINDITLGLHLNAPFYTSSQRSGRFCFGMFSDLSTTQKVVGYVKNLFPQTDQVAINDIENYINSCRNLFNQNIDPATKIAEKFITKERPIANSKYIDQNARKFGQEQLRVLIPTIFPTALTFTINLSALVALYRSAYDPPMRCLTDLMAKEILKLYPDLDYMFKRKDQLPTYLSPLDLAINIPNNCTLEYSPKLTLLSIGDLTKAVYPKLEDTHPIDTLHFATQFMPNNVIDIKTLVEISLATMGQDQRHKQIRRGSVDFTGGFYCPPIVEELDINNQLLQITTMWLDLSTKIHPALFRSLAPYGAMVRYLKVGNLNAVFHEQASRLCWCTQQEIYDISKQLREAISKDFQCSEQLLNMLSPKCYQPRICGEGKRYCGRTLTIHSADFFPKRLV